MKVQIVLISVIGLLLVSCGKSNENEYAISRLADMITFIGFCQRMQKLPILNLRTTSWSWTLIQINHRKKERSLFQLGHGRSRHLSQSQEPMKRLCLRE